MASFSENHSYVFLFGNFDVLSCNTMQLLRKVQQLFCVQAIETQCHFKMASQTLEIRSNYVNNMRKQQGLFRAQRRKRV